MTDNDHKIADVESQPSDVPAVLDESPTMKWDSLRDRLSGAGGQQFWRSLDELAETPEFLDYVSHEFPRQSGEWMDPVSRRSFLKLMAASLGFAGVGLSGCMRQPAEQIVPYVRQPEDFVPGRPLFFATCTMLGGYATGLLVESHLGRPTKIEGNPEHPASLGAADAFAQASILTLYDPDRSQTIMRGGRISTWGEFLTALSAKLPALRAPWPGIGDPHRNHYFAYARRSIEHFVEGAAGSEMAPVRARRKRQCAGRRQTGFRRARRYDLSLRSGRRGIDTGRRVFDRHARKRALCP